MPMKNCPTILLIEPPRKGDKSLPNPDTHPTEVEVAVSNKMSDWRASEHRAHPGRTPPPPPKNTGVQPGGLFPLYSLLVDLVFRTLARFSLYQNT